MVIIQTLKEMQAWTLEQRKAGKLVGLVPTMGYLHQGHLSLVDEVRKRCDSVVMSIFVNPLQFGAGEDFEEYPRDLSRDSRLAEAAGVDVIFAPPVREMYPSNYCTFIDVEKLTTGLCGESRPGHFRGVTTVVAKLLNIVAPHVAVFGQKDAQQALVIRRMVEDLNMPYDIIVAPIVREEDGLAMSSRNVYLNPEERKAALTLSKSLVLARQMIESGERTTSKVHKAMVEFIEAEPLAKIDYVEIVDGNNLSSVPHLEGKVLIALAVRFGKTRLIDNLLMEV